MATCLLIERRLHYACLHIAQLSTDICQRYSSLLLCSTTSSIWANEDVVIPQPRFFSPSRTLLSTSRSSITSTDPLSEYVAGTLLGNET